MVMVSPAADRAAADRSVDDQFVEVQGTGERATFNRVQLDTLLSLALAGIRALDAAQLSVLSATDPVKSR